MRNLQRPLPSLQLRAIFGGEVADLAQALALPPIWVRGVDDRDLVPRLQVELVGVPRFEVVEDHVEVSW